MTERYGVVREASGGWEQLALFDTLAKAEARLTTERALAAADCAAGWTVEPARFRIETVTRKGAW